MGYLTRREWRYAKIFFGVFKGGAQEVKVILGKCKGGGVEMIYIYFHRLWKVNDIYTFFFKGTFNLQIFFFNFINLPKEFFFWLSGDYRLPHFPFFLSSYLSFPFKKLKKNIFPPYFCHALFFPGFHFFFLFFSFFILFFSSSY